MNGWATFNRCYGAKSQMADDATRDRVRALVRDVLSKAVPATETQSSSKPTATSGRFANPLPSASPSGNITRDESAKLVITEDDMRGLERGAVLRISERARLTPLAADIVNDLGIEIVRRIPRSGSKQSKTVAVGADHGGYPMKEELKSFLEELGHRVHDFGTNSESAVDYPDGSKTITSDQMREIVRAWLGTEITEDRHRKRVAKIDAVERQYQR